MTWLHQYGDDVFYNLLLALLGVFAASCGLSQRHWFWKFATAISVGWLLVPTQGYEIIIYYLLVVTQVTAVLVVIRVVHARRSASRREGESRQLRFSLKDLLMATALAGAAMGLVTLLTTQNLESLHLFFGSSAAVAIPVLAACFIVTTPKRCPLKLIVALTAVAIASTIWRHKSWTPWLEPFLLPGLLAPHIPMEVAVATSVTILAIVMIGIAAIFPQRAGLTRPWARWTTREVLALAVLITLPIGVLLYLRLSIYETPPKVTLPAPNGQDVLLRVGNVLSNVNIPIPDTDSPDVFFRFVAQHSSTLETARAGLALPCRIPVTFTMKDIDSALAWSAATQRVARGLRAEGIAHEHVGDYPAAARSYIDVVRLATKSARGGLYVDLLYETLNGGDGITRLSDIRTHLDAGTCRKAAGQLATVDSNREAFEERARRERIWGQNAFGWRGRVLLAWEDWGFTDYSNEERLRTVDARYAAFLRLLLAELAVQAHRLEQGAAPSELDDLVPEYLSELPLDPDSGSPLRYRVDGPQSIVYSVGPDGDDDGGRPLTWTELAWGGDGDQILDFPEEEEETGAQAGAESSDIED